MLNVNASPSASELVGRKLYALPAFTEVTGVPLMTGARFAVPVAVIANAGRDEVNLPSLTVIEMPLNVPAAVGVPDNLPVVVLNVAHAGLFATLNASVSPS